MKAYEIREKFGIDSLTLTERPEPKPASGEVVIQWRAFSLNYRDLMVVKGAYNPKLRLPFTPFSDAAGRVVAVGDSVTRVKVGERVSSTFMPGWVAGEITEAKARSALGGGAAGVLAEFSVLSEDAVVAMPDHLSDEEAATLPCAAVTAWHALITAGNLKAGDIVLVQGTGGVSIFALQFAAMTGARVIVTSSSDQKLERALALGGRDGINYRTTPDWDKRARELTADRGVDHVVEVGGAGTLARSLKATRLGGTVSLIGVLTGGAGEINPLPILMKNIRVQGIFVGSREMFEAMNRAIALHHLRPVVDRVFPLDQVRDALRFMESGSHFGKIVVRL
jgi:NADPH:quinone reductase-like Zn-dependent oxidoreductase